MTTIPARPLPLDSSDTGRWEHSGLRVRMLLGLWEKDLEKKMAQYLDPQRRQAWGGVDLSSNVFKSITTQLSSLFDRQPTLFHADGADSLVGIGGAIEKAGLWPMMPRFQADTLGLREYAMRVSYDPRFGLRYRPVPPCDIVAKATPEDPETPVRIEELRLRSHPASGLPVWTWDILDISDPDTPIYQIRAAGVQGLGDDMTIAYLGADMSGAAYPYRRSSGEPVLPYVLFHAESTGRLFDPYNWREVVEGSLQAALLMTFFTHCARQSSWPQRYAVGVRVPNAEITDVDGGGRRARVPVDPTSLLMFEADGDGQPMVGQFNPSADLDVMLTAIMAYEHRVAAWSGISAADLQRQASGTARSGYALSVTNSAKREAQRKFAGVFRAGMTKLIEISAILLNSAEGLALPEEGYSIRFESIPKSADEMKASRENVLALMEAGLMDKLSAYQALNQGTSRREARDQLMSIRRVQHELETMPLEADTSIAEITPDTANVLNGAQVTSAKAIVEAVATGTLPRDSGIQMLSAFFGLSQVAADAIMGSVGKTFTPTPQT